MVMVIDNRHSYSTGSRRKLFKIIHLLFEPQSQTETVELKDKKLY